MADGKVTEAETVFLAEWLHNAEKDAQGWPFDAVNAAVQETVRQGMGETARENLYCMLKDLVGEITFVEVKRLPKHADLSGEVKDIRRSTALPYTQPVPDIVIFGNVFCFTGNFASGSRQDCCDVTMLHGGSFVDAVKKTVDYLVIGEESSRDWIQSSHGRKIEKAIDINSKGGTIAIVAEHDWQEAVRSAEQEKRLALLREIRPDLVDRHKR